MAWQPSACFLTASHRGRAGESEEGQAERAPGPNVELAPHHPGSRRTSAMFRPKAGATHECVCCIQGHVPNVFEGLLSE